MSNVWLKESYAAYFYYLRLTLAENASQPNSVTLLLCQGSDRASAGSDGAGWYGGGGQQNGWARMAKKPSSNVAASTGTVDKGFIDLRNICFLSDDEVAKIAWGEVPSDHAWLDFFGRCALPADVRVPRLRGPPVVDEMAGKFGAPTYRPLSDEHRRDARRRCALGLRRWTLETARYDARFTRPMVAAFERKGLVTPAPLAANLRSIKRYYATFGASLRISERKKRVESMGG
ncbi:hypothetical protein FIBSPDRAFT_975738 [Athelia psychrophila]|uniref:Uncharacterized protein n=1 Tax=Athelia psychrophila TaxID=1759441 RepID=A0A167SZF7_9AGAM|nr:hypothetical protein FIBSPDRAFT_975738 [Fibularhizoctonia sp. CBS 109695]